MISEDDLNKQGRIAMEYKEKKVGLFLLSHCEEIGWCVLAAFCGYLLYLANDLTKSPVGWWRAAGALGIMLLSVVISILIWCAYRWLCEWRPAKEEVPPGTAPADSE